MGTLANSEDPDEMLHNVLQQKMILAERNSILVGYYYL